MPQATRPTPLMHLWGLCCVTLLCLCYTASGQSGLGLGHNRILQQAHQAGWLLTPQSDEQLHNHTLAIVTQQAQLPDALLLGHFSQQYAHLGPQQLHTQLQLSAPCTYLLNQLWHMPEQQNMPDVQALIAQLGTAAQRLNPAEAQLVLRTCEVAAASANYWMGYIAPDDSTKPVNTRKLRWQRLMKADAFGMLKGALFGLFFFGANGIFFNLGLNMGIAGGTGIFLFFTAFESIRYANRLKAGKVKLEDDPWWGPQERKPF